MRGAQARTELAQRLSRAHSAGLQCPAQMSEVAGKPAVGNSLPSTGGGHALAVQQIAPHACQVHPRSQRQGLRAIGARVDIEQMGADELHVEDAVVVTEEETNPFLELLIGSNRDRVARLPAR